MPIRFKRYKRDPVGIGHFLHGPELGDALSEAVDKIIGYARAPLGAGTEAYWRNERGANMRIGAYSRQTREAINTHPAAAAREFGSGERGRGKTGSVARPQGGYNEPSRALGKAGARVGEFRGRLG